MFTWTFNKQGNHLETHGKINYNWPCEISCFFYVYQRVPVHASTQKKAKNPLGHPWDQNSQQGGTALFLTRQIGGTLVLPRLVIGCGEFPNYIYWLVVSTPLKYISQFWWLFPICGKLKMFQSTNQYMIIYCEFKLQTNSNKCAQRSG